SVPGPLSLSSSGASGAGSSAVSRSTPHCSASCASRPRRCVSPAKSSRTSRARSRASHSPRLVRASRAFCCRLTGRRSLYELPSLVILSQDVHKAFGGVVPELASRAHLTALPAVVAPALTEAGVTWTAVDAVVVTQGPGLAGALLVGVVYAKALAYAGGRALIGVHHMEGHLFAPAIEDPDLAPPFVALLVSGGHTLLLDVPAWGRYRLLGQPRDDAAGEAFDKVATLLGLEYPGGPAIERLAPHGDPARFTFPRPMRDD